jgi:hypothetical protein
MKTSAKAIATRRSRRAPTACLAHPSPPEALTEGARLKIITVRRGADSRWLKGPILSPWESHEHDALHAVDIYVPCWRNGLDLTEKEFEGLDLSTWPSDLVIERAMCWKPGCAGRVKRVIVG